MKNIIIRNNRFTDSKFLIIELILIILLIFLFDLSTVIAKSSAERTSEIELGSNLLELFSTIETVKSDIDSELKSSDMARLEELNTAKYFIEYAEKNCKLGMKAFTNAVDIERSSNDTITIDSASERRQAKVNYEAAKREHFFCMEAIKLKSRNETLRKKIYQALVDIKNDVLHPEDGYSKIKKLLP